VLPRQEKLMGKQDIADDSSALPSACYLLAARTVLLNVPLRIKAGHRALTKASPSSRRYAAILN
jgi:hypothetical protein